jgi:hypothetical protein
MRPSSTQDAYGEEGTRQYNNMTTFMLLVMEHLVGGVLRKEVFYKNKCCNLVFTKFTPADILGDNRGLSLEAKQKEALDWVTAVYTDTVGNV